MLLTVGGNSRKAGKTAIIETILRGIPGASWVAVKVAPHDHGEPGPALVEDTPPGTGDTGRYLAAGAARAWWLRSEDSATAMTALRGILAPPVNAVVESGGVVEFLDPDLYLIVLNYAAGGMKESTRRRLERADGFVVVDRIGLTDPWPLPARPRFLVRPPVWANPELIHFIEERI